MLRTNERETLNPKRETNFRIKEYCELTNAKR